MVSTAFAPVIGQNHAVSLLCQAIAHQRLAPAYLFVGPAGVGRRLAAQCFVNVIVQTTARSPRLPQRLNPGNHPDVLWVEPTYQIQGKLVTVSDLEASQSQRPRSRPQIRLEQIREIARFLSRPPMESSRSVVVLEHAETMAEAAANGLLKTLEEPGQATLILIASGLEAVLPTLVSRCQRISFARLDQAHVCQVLHQAGHGEILNHADILAMAEGSPGEAIKNWQRLQDLPPDLLPAATSLPRSPREALQLAQLIDAKLDVEAQLWLVSYLQHYYWRQQLQPWVMHQLEQVRQQLLVYAQPRLVWEVALLNLSQTR